MRVWQVFVSQVLWALPPLVSFLLYLVVAHCAKTFHSVLDMPFLDKCVTWSYLHICRQMTHYFKALELDLKSVFPWLPLPSLTTSQLCWTSHWIVCQNHCFIGLKHHRLSVLIFLRNLPQLLNLTGCQHTGRLVRTETRCSSSRTLSLSMLPTSRRFCKMFPSLWRPENVLGCLAEQVCNFCLKHTSLNSYFRQWQVDVSHEHIAIRQSSNLWYY